MANAATDNVHQPAEPVRRSPTDAIWFTVLILSIATGIGMTIFAPVNGTVYAPAPAAATSATAATEPTEPMEPSDLISPTLISPTPATATQPSTAPLP